jgi:hypothetical protein
MPNGVSPRASRSARSPSNTALTLAVGPALEFSMSNPTFDDSQPVEGDDTGAPTEPEEYGSLSVEDDPGGTVDPAELADTASESDEDVK